MKKIETKDAVGHVICHDITIIVKDQIKDTAFRKGHIVSLFGPSMVKNFTPFSQNGRK